MRIPLHALIVEGSEGDTLVLLCELRHGVRAWTEAAVEHRAAVFFVF